MDHPDPTNLHYLPNDERTRMVLIKKLSPFTGDIKYWRTMAFIVFVSIVVTGIFANRVAIQKANEAVEKSCILINDKILEGAQNAANPEGPTDVLIASIVRRMTPQERQQLLEARRNQPTDVTKIDCQKVTEHPEDIRATEGKAR